jgi:carboxyl-terminal processing protease
MKTLQRNNLTTLSILMLMVISCQVKDINTIDNLNVNKASVNSWTYDMMNDGYFWYKEMPGRNATDTSESPDAYFEKLIYKRQTHDRFSMITDNIEAVQQQFNGVTKAFGLHYQMAYIDEGKINVAAFLSHVSKGSPADAAGLKRGDIITKVNGTSLTKDNYAKLIGGSETIRINLGKLNGDQIDTDPKNISITRAQISENPIAFSSIISKGNKKVGYLVYNQFVPGTDADKNKYDNELRSVFAGFKSAGVNELVLDLRLNGGGYMSSAVTLSSLIVSNYSASKIFYKEQWNDKFDKYWKEKNGADALTYKFLDEKNNIGNQLGRIFVLTSQGTASASELIINGLKPYMNVITVGDHTAGKNLFGSLIGDEKKRWKYGLYIMLGQTVNANGQSDYGTSEGIAASKPTDDSRVPFLPFGDENETLLNDALKEMGIQTGQPARLASHKKFSTVSPASERDAPVAWDQKMIRESAVSAYPVDI